MVNIPTGWCGRRDELRTYYCLRTRCTNQSERPREALVTCALSALVPGTFADEQALARDLGILLDAKPEKFYSPSASLALKFS